MKTGDRVRMIDDPTWKGTIVEKWDAKGIVYLTINFDNGQKAVQVQRGQVELIPEENCQAVARSESMPSNKTIAEALFAASKDLVGTAEVRPFGWALASAARVFQAAAKADAQAAQVLFDEIDLTTPPDMNPQIPTNIDRRPPTLYMRSVSHWQTPREVHEQGRKSPYSRYVVRVAKHHLGSYELTLLAPDPVSHGQAPFHVAKGETVFFSDSGVKAHNETATVTLPRAKLVHCIALIASGHEQKARFQLEQLLL